MEREDRRSPLRSWLQIKSRMGVCYFQAAEDSFRTKWLKSPLKWCPSRSSVWFILEACHKDPTCDRGSQPAGNRACVARRSRSSTKEATRRGGFGRSGSFEMGRSSCRAVLLVAMLGVSLLACIDAGSSSRRGQTSVRHPGALRTWCRGGVFVHRPTCIRGPSPQPDA